MKEKIVEMYLTSPYIVKERSLQTHFLRFEIMNDSVENLVNLEEKLNSFDTGEPIILYLHQKKDKT